MRSIFSLLGVLSFAAGTALAAEVSVINGRAAYPEGPTFIDGKLYYAENGANTIDVWDGSTNIVFWKSDGCGPSAVQPFGSDLIVTCSINNSLARVTRDGRTIATWDRDKDGGSIQTPNDLIIDGKGGVYFTASGPWESAPIAGKIFHMVEDGTITEVANDLHFPTGLTLGADGRLYVSESEAGRVISFAIRDDGTLTDRRLFVRVGTVDPAAGADAYPHGLKFGPDGNLYIGLYSSGRIVAVAPAGTFVKAIEVPSPAAQNMAFSPDGKLLYVTAVDDKTSGPYWGKVYQVPLQ